MAEPGLSFLSQTALQSVADWKPDKHQPILRFNPSVMLADHRPNRSLVNRQLTSGHLGTDRLKVKKKQKENLST